MKPLCALAVIGVVVGFARADIVVDYSQFAGGRGGDAPGGLSARATFRTSGTKLRVLLENTSTSTPSGFSVEDSLLTSLALNLPVPFASGDFAEVAPGSRGLGAWSYLREGDSVAKQWLWTNSGASDVLANYSQVISTSKENKELSRRFDGTKAAVKGAYGGIAALDESVRRGRLAISNSIVFQVTLAGELSEEQLRAALRGSKVEFGNDARYLQPVPSPGAALLAGVGAACIALVRRRHASAA